MISMLLPISALLGVFNSLFVKLDLILFKQWQSSVNIMLSLLNNIGQLLFICFNTLKKLAYKTFNFLQKTKTFIAIIIAHKQIIFLIINQQLDMFLCLITNLSLGLIKNSLLYQPLYAKQSILSNIRPHTRQFSYKIYQIKLRYLKS